MEQTDLSGKSDTEADVGAPPCWLRKWICLHISVFSRTHVCFRLLHLQHCWNQTATHYLLERKINRGFIARTSQTLNCTFPHRLIMYIQFIWVVALKHGGNGRFLTQRTMPMCKKTNKKQMSGSRSSLSKSESYDLAADLPAAEPRLPHSPCHWTLNCSWSCVTHVRISWAPCPAASDSECEREQINKATLCSTLTPIKS